MSDEHITDLVVRAARDGDGRALETIYLELAPAVHGYLRAKGVSDPEGLTSEVFVGLIRRLPTITGGAEGVRKVVFSIAHARMVDDYRRRERSVTSVPYEHELDARFDASAESRAGDSLATKQVLAVLAVLPEDQRNVLALRVIADLSIEQTAEVIGRSVGAVKQLQRRGLLAVRRALEERRVTL